MKKIFLICTLVVLSFNGFSQTCEEREPTMLTMIGGISAGMIYNTYQLINSVKEGFSNKIYSNNQVEKLMNSQRGMIDYLTKSMDSAIQKNTFIHNDDKEYVNSMVDILMGLFQQATLMIDLLANNNTSNADKYEKQRKINWDKISNILGFNDDDN